jgi:hypothetical protein
MKIWVFYDNGKMGGVLSEILMVECS